MIKKTDANVILPPATIGIIGGGQLGRMMALAAKPMGYRVGILDPTPDSPAGQVADFQITAEYNDATALAKLADESDVITYEFENVDQNALSQQSNVRIPQGIALLDITSNRIQEKTFIRDEAQVPVADFVEIKTPADLEKAILSMGTPLILKTTSGGYDGHGQWDINDIADLAEMKKHWPNAQLIVEKKIRFTREVSVMVTRSANGDITTWPIAENNHQHHILKTSLAPANISHQLAQEIEDIATKIATALSLRGVLGVELFINESTEEIWVNELAPRPHNSGHYSIEATTISQFEGHIRSIVGLPIPQIECFKPALMLNLLGDELIQARQALANHPEWHFHDYGKAVVKQHRKMGHITVLGEDNIAKLLNWAATHQEGTEDEQ